MDRCPKDPKDEPTGKNLVCKKSSSHFLEKLEKLLGQWHPPPPPFPLPGHQRVNICSLKLRQRLHRTGSIWNWYKLGMDKPCVYTGPGGSGTDRICYLVPNGSTYEGDPMCNLTVPV